jgi:hypothetical protein
MYKVDYIINNEKTVLAIDLFYNGEFVVPDDSLYNYKILKVEINT